MTAKKNEYMRVYYKRNRDAIRARTKHNRRNNVAQAILSDARRADRKRKHENDLTLAFVTEFIARPCDYCGDEELRKTLDRIDNERGHIRTNIVVACERCNYVRRNMPHVAWMVITPAMRDARVRGLFGDWTGAIHRREPLDPLPLPALRERAPHGTLTRYFRCGPPRCQPCKDAMAKWRRKRRREISGP
jgi:hypothetical protein